MKIEELLISLGYTKQKNGYSIHRNGYIEYFQYSDDSDIVDVVKHLIHNRRETYIEQGKEIARQEIAKALKNIGYNIEP